MNWQRENTQHQLKKASNLSIPPLFCKHYLTQFVKPTVNILNVIDLKAHIFYFLHYQKL